MADPRTVVEGTLKYRDGRKWKPRWCVASKLSPVADCLHLQFYRDSKDKCKNGLTKASLSLENFLGMETGFTLDKESNTLALICSEMVVVLAFDSRELLIQWQVKIRANLCEEMQYLVQISHVPPKSKLACGPARLHLEDQRFCLVAGVPPRLLGTWPLKELRRFGVVDSKFCFEGGSRCGKGEGAHVLLTNQAEDLTQSFELALKGKLGTKRKSSSRKSSVIDGSRMSLQPRCSHHISTYKCSTESCRPLLLSSGSECSACDACSAIFNFASDGKDGEPLCKSDNHYKWPSSVSHAKSEMDSTDCLSTATTDFHGTLMRRSILSGHSSIQGSHMNWFSSHCQSCGSHFTLRSNVSLKGRSRSPSPDTHTNGNNTFMPQWTMDFHDANIHSRTGPQQVHKPVNKSPADRASICSQSSHSSGSSLSSSNSSEYNVPRNVLESFYDHPRNLHSVRTVDSLHRISENGGANDSFEMCSVCAYQNWGGKGSPSDSLPSVHRIPCSCSTTFVINPRTSVAENGETITKDSCTTSPTKGQSASVLQKSCPCDGGQNPYAHYAVPRSTLVSIFSKDESAAEKTDAENGVPKGNQVVFEEYDVPKKIKENLAIGDMKTLPIVSHLKATPCLCNFPGPLGNTKHNDGTGIRCQQDSLQPCACRKVMLWAGSLVPCWKAGNPDEAVTHASPHLVDTNGLFSKTLPHPAVCTEPAKRAFMTMRPTCTCFHSAQSNAAVPQSGTDKTKGAEKIPNYVNIQAELQDGQGQNQCNAETSSAEQRNYANLHFIETLPLYENAGDILGRLGDVPQQDPNKLNADSNRRKPPLPPRVSTPKDTITTTKSDDGITPSVTAAYELMSFPRPEEAILTTADNYLIMQPVCSRVLVMENEDCERTRCDEIKVSNILPLRPFMPYMMPCDELSDPANEMVLDKDRRTGSLGSVRSPGIGRKGIIDEIHLRSCRSNSLEGLKRKVLLKKRSCSADSRQNNAPPNDGSETDENCVAEVEIQKTPKRKNSLFSRISLRTKEKSYSTDEISPPSSVPSSPSNAKSFENLHRLPFHHSADCLKQKEEYHLSEDDIPSNVFSESLHADFKYNMKIKRSCSAPCKDKEKCGGSSSDSACLSDMSSNSDKGNILSDKQYIIDENYLETDVKEDNTAMMNFKLPNYNSKDRKMPTHPEEHKNSQVCLKHDLEGKEKLVLCGSDARNPGSTSSSDMSDYIETLSLCSGTSSSSGGSSSDYVRTEELCALTTTAGGHANSVNTMRPRFGKEYHSIDRSLLQDTGTSKKECGLPPATDDQLQLSRDLRNNLNTFVSSKPPFPSKSGSPSPGYISSSPGTVDCNCSPSSSFGSHFQFPKDMTKELNYMEMELLEPITPAVKTESVQYAVIDRIATEAAKKLSCEREIGRSDSELDRNENVRKAD